ncbi:hypothetical protein NQ317_001772 [Molorchus minor]|uniref:Bis(5'-nucleosyl)-tetraphosphatase [asymmetrical] n=1 Tax=Molorchus minor TaxID=1323400 RepID=A0ABQ9JHU4_9CUCU|nr:hypothetical protein NQ317_001772 [Molorchus minor]
MNNLQDLQTQKSYRYLQEVETVAQDILTTRETKLELSNAQNKFREALRALEKIEDRNTWMQLGSVYIKRNTDHCKVLLRNEIAKAEEDLNSLQKEIKDKKPRHSIKVLDFSELENCCSSMAPKVAAGFVIFRRMCEKVEYLLLQTSYGIHHWTPPKGHVDPGETEMLTALRETEEEAGLVKGKPKTVYYWLAELINPNAQVKLSDEHQDYKWLELDDACRYSAYGDMQEVLHDFDKYIRMELTK